MVKYLRKSGIALLLILCFSFFCIPIYGETDDVFSVNSGFTYTGEADMVALISDMVNELEKNSDYSTVNYSFKLNVGNTTKNLEYATNLQIPIIEYLEGVLTITPSVSLSVKGNVVTVKITRKEFSSNYEEQLNLLVSEAKTLNSDSEKIHYLVNYLYKNGYLYNFDAFNLEGIKSSNIIDSTDCMPDGVLDTKLGVAVGYANLMSDYLEELGIPSVKLRGYNETGYHVWNMAYINMGNGYDWYCVDTVNSLHKLNDESLITVKGSFPIDVVWVDNLFGDVISLKYSESELLEYAYGNYFIDIDNHWAKSYIIKLYVKDLVNGYGDRTFRPNNDITIAEFLQIAIASCVPASERVNESVWYDGVYNYALQNGIINPLLFPEDSLMNSITREEMSYILVKIDEIVNKKESVNIDNLYIVDENEITGVYKDAVYQSYAKGLIIGVDSLGTFNPKGLATRAEASTIIYRMLGL